MIQWKIPLTDIELGIRQRLAVTEVLKSRWPRVNGVVQAFEWALAKYLGAGHAVAVSSGAAALHLGLKVLGLKEGDEVICPSFSFAATANAILHTGATPVFAEINGVDDLTLSPADLEEKINPRTRAIVAVHYGGYPCRMASILELARRHHLFVIEDAAQAVGAEYAGRRCGTLGDIACLGFFADEGGILITDNPLWASKARLLRSHGMTPAGRGCDLGYDVLDLGLNCRMDEVRAALGLSQLETLEENNFSRTKKVQRYRELLEDLKGIRLPFAQANGHRPAPSLFPIILDEEINREQFVSAMREAGLQTGLHYPAIHQLSYYRQRWPDLRLPLTECASRREVTLPLFASLSEGQIELIVKKVGGALKDCRGQSPAKKKRPLSPTPQLPRERQTGPSL